MSAAPEQTFDSRSDTALLCGVAACFLLLHVAFGGRYGFHRDELATLDDARRLATGYVAYPPLTPFVGRISLTLFGTSLRGFRFFAALAQAVIVVLAGLMARELGGRKLAQLIAAFAVAISPVSLAAGALLQYVTFDFLWWVLTAYLLIRLLRTDEPRLWLAIGTTVGLGMMTKYTMLFFVAGIVAGLLLTSARRYLKSRWLWMGVVISLLIFLPNMLWQIHHGFISLDFLKHIHARDIRIGRTQKFLPEQLYIAANVVTVPLWIAGLFFYFRSSQGKRFRLLGWAFVVTLAIFIVAKGRGYYMAPAYPMLLAAGAVLEERWLASLSRIPARTVRFATFVLLIVGGALAACITLPLVPVNSRLWNVAIGINGDFREELGWEELVAEVARIRDTLPPEERAKTGILATNYGEAGSIDLYGPAYGLPKAISGVNSYWAYGYGNPPPETLIVLGLSQKNMKEDFQSCELAGHITNRYGVKNEETGDHPDIYICRQLRRPWPAFWDDFRYYG